MGKTSTWRLVCWGAAVVFLASAFVNAGQDDEPAAPVRPAPLLDGIGSLHFPISTEVADAQRYFNQGLTLAFGFNHAEAVRSFQAAAALDPGCGICYAGTALALGPNINAPMSQEAIAPAWRAVVNALARKANETPREQDYIDAISRRYSADGAERKALDAAYAKAMRTLVDKHAEDLHARTLYAEALMDLSPWSYWRDDGAPKEHTQALVAALELVLERDPNHPGAAHLYIHVMERFTPGKAEAAADRLGALAPVAGHLVHMPSHIYLRLGRYHDAVVANERAAAADEDYIAQCNAQGFYPAAYYPHNLHFLWYSAMMEGRRALALETAAKLRSRIPLRMAQQFGPIQAYLPAPMYTFVRFGLRQEALAAPAEAAELPFARAMRHYGRGLAHAAQGELDQARRELAALEGIRRSGALDRLVLRQGDAVSRKLADIAANLMRADLAKRMGDGKEEIRLLREAVRIQLSLPYSEPPLWHYPVRQSLGAALLRQGDFAAAQAVFTDDLAQFPENGWSLHGLGQALAMSGEATDAVTARLQAAWRYADVEPATGW